MYTKFELLYAFFWVIPRSVNFICRRFGTLCLFHLHKRIGRKNDQVENVGVFIREKVWLEPNLFPYKYSKILNLSTFFIYELMHKKISLKIILKFT
jgi:hypothetical protein